MMAVLRRSVLPILIGLGIVAVSLWQDTQQNARLVKNAEMIERNTVTIELQATRIAELTELLADR